MGNTLLYGTGISGYSSSLTASINKKKYIVKWYMKPFSVCQLMMTISRKYVHVSHFLNSALLLATALWALDKRSVQHWE
jgi:hypothetical protein